AFEGDRIIYAAAQVEPVFLVLEFVGDLFDRIALGGDALDLVGDCFKGFEIGLQVALGKVFSATEHEGNHGQHEYLANIGLGAGDADFGTDVEIDPGVGFAGNGRADGIYDAQDQGAFFLGLADGGQSVGGLARLADGDHDRAGVEDGVAIAEFGGVFDFG